MTPEQLLIPRYEVIAPGKSVGELPYPHSPYAVGDIIDCGEHPEYSSGKVRGTTENRDFFDGYPNIFRPLRWYWLRELSDMPRRVKYGEQILNGWWVTDGETGLEFHTDTTAYYAISLLLPATEAEYKEYLKSMKNPVT